MKPGVHLVDRSWSSSAALVVIWKRDQVALLSVYADVWGRSVTTSALSSFIG